MENNRQATIEWVPVTKKLPQTVDFRTSFLVTVRINNRKDKVMVAEWENTTVKGKNDSRWMLNVYWRHRVLFPSEWEVIAWSPLPAPYEDN